MFLVLQTNGTAIQITKKSLQEASVVEHGGDDLQCFGCDGTQSIYAHSQKARGTHTSVCIARLLME